MAFIEPTTTDYGLAEMPTRLYGGIVYSADRVHGRPTHSAFIPLHNRATFHKRPLLFPHPIALPVPICYVRHESNRMFVNRLSPTLSDSFMRDGHEAKQRNRNLLSGEFATEDTIRLWNVDDNGERKRLYEIPITLDVPDDFHSPIRVRRGEDPWYSTTSIELDSDAYELRSYDREKTNGRLFVRTSTGLDLHKPEDKTVAKLCDWPIVQFERIAYMDEVAVVDSLGLVFYSDVEQVAFTRIKSGSKIRTVTTTDSPSQLLLASDTHVYQTDIREFVGRPRVLFDFNKNRWKIAKIFSPAATEFLKERERIWHVNCLRPQTDTFLITGTQQIFVLDRRMPDLPLFYMNHFNLNGGEYCVTSGPFVHEELEMDVYQYFSLSRVTRPQIAHWAVGWNRQEAVWTSMGPTCQLESPQSLIGLCKSQVYLPNLSEEVKQKIPKVTRAIYCQHFPENLRSNENRALMFRQMDNGQIWFESIHFAKPKPDGEHEGVERESTFVRQAADEVLEFMEKMPRDTFEVNIDPLFNQTPKGFLKLVDQKRFRESKLLKHQDAWKTIAMNSDESRTSVPLDEVHELLVPPLDSSPADVGRVEVIAGPPSNDHLMSKIVTDMITKARSWMSEESGQSSSHGPPPDRPEEEAMDEDEDYVVDEEEINGEEGSYSGFKGYF